MLLSLDQRVEQGRLMSMVEEMSAWKMRRWAWGSATRQTRLRISWNLGGRFFSSMPGVIAKREVRTRGLQRGNADAWVFFMKMHGSSSHRRSLKSACVWRGCVILEKVGSADGVGYLRGNCAWRIVCKSV